MNFDKACLQSMEPATRGSMGKTVLRSNLKNALDYLSIRG